MKLFEEQKPLQDVVLLFNQLFKEFKENNSENLSKYLSPSGLSCQVSCAFKLQGITTEPEKESFQSASFAAAGEDRHKRIQEFLSITPYWVDVSKYIKEKGLPLKAVVKVNTKKYNTPERELPREIDKDDIEEFLSKYNLPRDAIKEDEFETLLVHTSLPIRFKCDGILLIDGIYYILEIKTEGERKNNGRSTYDPKHQLQGKAYTWLFKIEKILWVYEGRDSLVQRFFVQLVTPKEKLEIRNYIQKIVDNFNTPENLEKDETQCKYCNYKKYCKKYFSNN